MKHGLGLNKILGTIHTYPTLAEANKYAAGEWKRAHAPAQPAAVGGALSRLGARHEKPCLPAPNAGASEGALGGVLASRSRASARTLTWHGGTACVVQSGARRLRPRSRGLDGPARASTCGWCAAARPRRWPMPASRRIAALNAYLDSAVAVTRSHLRRAGPAEQQAFLINAYNAFTVELILTRYPDLKSIKDLGQLLVSPWKPKWVALLGKVSLDDIEHAMLRKRGELRRPAHALRGQLRQHRLPGAARGGLRGVTAGRADGRADAALHERPHAQPLQRAARAAGAVEDLRLVRRGLPPRHRGIAFAAGLRGALRPISWPMRPPTASASVPASVDIAFTDYDWALNDAGDEACPCRSSSRR